MPMSSKEMIKLLERNGFIYVKSGDGSHRKFKNPKTGKVTQVPYHSKEGKSDTETSTTYIVPLLAKNGGKVCL